MATHFLPNFPTDSLMHYGDGLFETMLAVEGEIINFDYHFSRLQNGCKRLEIACPSEAEIKSAFNAQVQSTSQVVKLILSRGEALRGYRTHEETDSFAYISASDYPLTEPVGKTLVVSNIHLSKQPLLAGLKHTNRLEQIMAKRALPDFADEAVILDTDGLVVEAISHNIFWQSEMGWHTPALAQSGVAGTMRAQILDRARKNGIQILVEEYALADLLNAKSVFLTNAVAGIVPVTKINEKIYNFDKLAVYALCRDVTHPCLNFYSEPLSS